MKNGYGKILRANIASRRGRNEKRYGKILRANMVSRTGRNEKHVGNDIDNEYGFPFLKT